jgi:hypothetical protein
MAATFGATQESYDTVGRRESLSDLIYNIAPTETPFLMMAGRGTATAIKEEWQMDSLAAPANNAVEESEKVATVLTVEPTIRVINYCQISSKHLSVSGTAEVINKAGRNSELSYQLAKRAKELKRDIEFTCVGTTIAPLATDPRQSASVANYFHTALDGQVGTAPALDGAHTNIGTGTLGGWDGSVHDPYVDGAARALTESMVKGVIQGAWTNGGDPTILMCDPFNKTVISGFTGNSTRFDRGEDKRLVAAIDVYVSDFGEHRAVPNRFFTSSGVQWMFAFTPELWEICYLRPFRQHALAKIGDSEDRTILAEWTLKGLNHAGNGAVFDIARS